MHAKAPLSQVKLSVNMGLQQELTVWAAVLSLLEITTVYQRTQRGLLLRVVTFIKEIFFFLNLPLCINLALNIPPWLKCCYLPEIIQGFEHALVLQFQFVSGLYFEILKWQNQSLRNTDSKLRAPCLLEITLSSSRNILQSTGEISSGETERVFNKLRITNMARISLDCYLSNVMYVRRPLQFNKVSKVYNIHTLINSSTVKTIAVMLFGTGS